MASLRRVRAVLGIDASRTVEVLDRAQRMYDALKADPVTYAAPNPELPELLDLIQVLRAADQVVGTRLVGAAAVRDVHRRDLVSAMESERSVVQLMADADRARAIALIENAGLLVAGAPVHSKPPLTLRLGPQAGTIVCDANVGMLVRASGTTKPWQYRCFNWEHTLDDGQSFIATPSTPRGKTVLHGFPPAARVGVRVSMTNSEGTGAWSQVVSILVER